MYVRMYADTYVMYVCDCWMDLLLRVYNYVYTFVKALLYFRKAVKVYLSTGLCCAHRAL